MFTVNNLESRKKHTGKKCKLSIILLSFFFFCNTTWLMGSQFPGQVLNSGPQQWKCGVLTTLDRKGTPCNLTILRFHCPFSNTLYTLTLPYLSNSFIRLLLLLLLWWLLLIVWPPQENTKSMKAGNFPSWEPRMLLNKCLLNEKYSKRHMHPNSRTTNIYNSQDMEAT